MKPNPPSDAMAAAIEWLVQSRSGQMDASQKQGFEAWYAADPLHAQTWTKLQARLQTPTQALVRLEAGRGNAGTSTKAQHSHANQALRQLLVQPSRRVTLRNLALMVLGASSGALLLDRHTPLRTLTADLRTGTGERRRFTLPDQSSVILNARSAVALGFSQTQRMMTVLQGDIQVDVASQASLPLFCVATSDGEAYPSERMALSLRQGGTTVLALEGAVRLQAAHGQTMDLAPGKGMTMQADGFAADGSAIGLADWQQGILAAAPLPLGEVVGRLQAYTARILQVSPQAAHLRVQARLPLDDVDLALRALSEALPIRVRHLGPLWSRIDLA